MSRALFYEQKRRSSSWLRAKHYTMILGRRKAQQFGRRHQCDNNAMKEQDLFVRGRDGIHDSRSRVRISQSAAMPQSRCSSTTCTIQTLESLNGPKIALTMLTGPRALGVANRGPSVPGSRPVAAEPPGLAAIYRQHLTLSSQVVRDSEGVAPDRHHPRSAYAFGVAKCGSHQQQRETAALLCVRRVDRQVPMECLEKVSSGCYITAS